MTRPDAEEAIQGLLQDLSAVIAGNHVSKTGVGYQERRKIDDKYVDDASSALLDLLDRYCEGAVEKAGGRMDVNTAKVISQILDMVGYGLDPKTAGDMIDRIQARVNDESRAPLKPKSEGDNHAA